MKKIQAMMLMLLLVVMGLSVQSCGSDETTTNLAFVYTREPLDNLRYKDKVVSEYTPSELAGDPVLLAFGEALVLADGSMGNLDGASDNTVMNIYKNALAPFTSGKGFEGYVLLMKSNLDGSNKREIGRITFTK